MLGRRILSEDEKLAIMERCRYECYICRGDIINPDEAEFVHVVPLDQGGTFSLENYAPLHNYCFLKAAEQELDFARDDAQINPAFSVDFEQIFEVRRAAPTVSIDKERMVASVDDEAVPLYRCPNTGVLYFYHQIPAAYLETDVALAPQGLQRQRVVALTGHLREHPQLNPVVCRLDDGHLRVITGLHRAAAQYLGNRNLRIDCKVLVDGELNKLREAEKAVRGHLRTRPRKPADLTDWLLSEFRPQITAWQEIHPEGDLSEAVILQGVLSLKEHQACRALEEFLSTWLTATPFWHDLTARCKEAAVLIPESLAPILVRGFMQTRPGRASLESAADYRQEEMANMQDLLGILLENGLFAVRERLPFMPALLQTQLREAGVILWTGLLADAFRIVLQRNPDTGIAYGPPLVPLEKIRMRRITQNLFGHPFWQDLDLDRALRQEDHLYLEKAREKWGISHQHLLRA